MEIKTIPLLLIVFLMPAILIAGENFIAEVYKQDTDPPLLLYYHYNDYENNGDIKILSHYYLMPDSSEAVVEKAVLRNGTLWKYNADFYVTDESSEITLENDQLSIIYNNEGKIKSKSISFRDTLLVGPIFVEHLVSKWDQLLSGKTVRFRLPAPDMLTSAGFYLKKINNSKYEQPSTVVIKMGVSSFFLKLLIKPSYFVMDTETRRVKEIHGLSILPHQENGTWTKTTHVNIYFTYN
ncbi:MAG: hypothetical protein RAP70_02915 [Candidatus Celaenobacter antarcticus]|nr:hypothetical protein [Candidatus Celaenobacter antarcticus]MDP8314007.1 hypothetical protein [Candidatus Celaenobacter antarcticus]